MYRYKSWIERSNFVIGYLAFVKHITYFVINSELFDGCIISNYMDLENLFRIFYVMYPLLYAFMMIYLFVLIRNLFSFNYNYLYSRVFFFPIKYLKFVKHLQIFDKIFRGMNQACKLQQNRIMYNYD